MFVGRGRVFDDDSCLFASCIGKLESHMCLATDLFFFVLTKQREETARAIDRGWSHQQRLENLFFWCNSSIRIGHGYLMILVLQMV